MTNLVPVKLPDKNGVMVTRWVKPRDTGEPARGKVPAPHVLSWECKALSEALVLDASNLSNVGIKREDILRKVRRLPERTAGALNSMLVQNDNPEVVSDIIVTALHRNDPPETLENISLLYNDYQYETDEWSWQEHSGYTMISADIRGLLQYPQFAGVKNINREDDATKERAKTLGKIMYEADKDPSKFQSTATFEGNANRLKDPEFVQLVWDNSDTAEKAGTVLDLVYEWGCDTAAVRQALDTTVPLRGGVL